MARSRPARTSTFSVPRISKSIEHSRRKERRVIPDGKIQQPVLKPIVDVNAVPTIKMGERRANLLKRLLEKGRIKKSSDYTYGQLQTKKAFPTIVHSEVDCLDEAELRSKFPKQGVNHKFFSSGQYKFEFWLPCDSDNVVVAQVHWNGKVRMPHSI